MMSQSAQFASSVVNRRQFLCASALVTGAALAGYSAQAAEEDVWTVGVIGHTGHGNYGHDLDTMWLHLPQTRVVAFSDPNEKGREKEAKKLPGAKAFSDYREMLKEMKPEIVAVCPRELEEHHQMVLAAINSGARGVYCEKPFCRTPQEADEIVAACRQTGCKLSVAHRNRFHPALPAVKAAIEDGAIGRLLEIRSRGKEDKRGGCLDLWVLGSHLIDMVRYFAGNALSCSAVIQQDDRLVTPADLQQGAESVGLIAGNRVHARYEMQNGLPLFFDSIQNAGVTAAQFGIQLIGNGGIIDIRIDQEPLAHLVPGNPFRPTETPRPWIPITSGGVGVTEPIKDLAKIVARHQGAALDLIAAIQENRPTLCSEVDGLANVEMIHAVFASHIANGARVALPLASRTHPFADWKTSGS